MKVRQVFGKLYPFPTNAVAFKPKLRVTSFFTLLHKAQTCLFTLNNKRTKRGLHHLHLIQSSPWLCYVRTEACEWLTKEWIERSRNVKMKLNERRKSAGWKMEGWGWLMKCFFDWWKLLEKLTKCLKGSKGVRVRGGERHLSSVWTDELDKLS